MLINLTQNKNRLVRGGAIQGLIETKDIDILPIFLDVLEEQFSLDIILDTLFALGLGVAYFPDLEPDKRDYILSILEDISLNAEDILLREVTTRISTNIRDVWDVDSMEEIIMEETDRGIKFPIIDALQTIGNLEATDTLLRIISEDSDLLVRLTASLTLVDIVMEEDFGYEELVPELTILKDRVDDPIVSQVIEDILNRKLPYQIISPSWMTEDLAKDFITIWNNYKWSKQTLAIAVRYDILEHYQALFEYFDGDIEKFVHRIRRVASRLLYYDNVIKSYHLQLDEIRGILDLGCGKWDYLLATFSMFDKVSFIYGVESNNSQFRKAEEYVLLFSLNPDIAKLFQFDMTKFGEIPDMEGKKFDIISMFSSYNWIANYASFEYYIDKDPTVNVFQVSRDLFNNIYNHISDNGVIVIYGGDFVLSSIEALRFAGLEIRLGLRDDRYVITAQKPAINNLRIIFDNVTDIEYEFGNIVSIKLFDMEINGDPIGTKILLRDDLQEALSNILKRYDLTNPEEYARVMNEIRNLLS